MSDVASDLLLPAAATIAWATAGASLNRRTGSVAATTDRTLGCGLLVGAVLLGMDTLTIGPTAMPLSSWALLALGALAMLPGVGSAWRGLAECGWRRPLAAFAAFLVLHWLHQNSPNQPTLNLGFGNDGAGLRPLDLLAATALGWLALRNLPANTSTLLTPMQQRALFGGTATGLLLAAFGGPSAGNLTAAFQIAAVLPLLWPALLEGDRSVTTAAATAVAATTALGLRAWLMAAGNTSSALPMADALLAIAAMFVVFGIAANRDEPATAPALPAPRQAPATLTMRDLGSDLRTPLTSLLAAAELLRDAGSPSERAGHLATLHDQGRQLTSTLADLEDFERLLRGELAVVDDTFALADLLRQSHQEASAMATERGIEIRLDLAADLPAWAQGDPTRVRHLAIRLLELAVQRCSIGHVDFSASASDGTLHLVVQNHTAATRPDPSDTTMDPHFGHGIGLRYCQQVAMVMGGDLQATEREQGGVVLLLTLPLVPVPAWEVEIAEGEAARHAAPATAPLHVAGQVLLVDDSRDHQRLIGHLLSRAGAQVTAAENGAIALLLLQDQTFDLVLMDMQMPELDGYAATQELRRRGITTPVVALTADGGEAAVERCLSAGCNSHLTKPIDRAVMQQLLTMYLPAALPS